MARGIGLTFEDWLKSLRNMELSRLDSVPTSCKKRPFRLRPTWARLLREVMPNLTWSSLSLPAPGRLLRRLSGTVDVALVWGLRAVETTPLLGKLEKAWHFEAGPVHPTALQGRRCRQEAFRIEAPATQRTLYAACSLGQKHPGMLVTSSECWVEEFRNYVARQGYPFPATCWTSALKL